MLPFLHGADEVAVATVGGDGRHEGTKAVTGHLARHGAHVTTQFLQATDSDGGEILDFALRQDADLIVMGAYGHSRLREWSFRGGHARGPRTRAGLLPDVPLMRRSNAAILRILAPIILALIVPEASASPADRGLAYDRAHCGRCHAVGLRRTSPMREASSFRNLADKFPVGDLADVLVEDVDRRHPAMPDIRLAPSEAADLTAYLEALRPGRRP